MHENSTLTRERQDLIESLAIHRMLLRGTAARVADEQARATPTVSDLSVGGIIKHVAATERGWADFMVNGPRADEADRSDPTPEQIADYQAGFRQLPGEPLAGVLAEYSEVAAATDALVATIDLDLDHPLPEAPWFPPGATRTARRTIAHIIAETAHHAGHADIIRESIDGQRSMG